MSRAPTPGSLTMQRGLAGAAQPFCRVGDRVIAPNLPEQGGVADGLARVKAEVTKELVLGRGEPDRPTADRDEPRREIDHEIADADDGLARRDVGLTAQHGADPRDQLL